MNKSAIAEGVIVYNDELFKKNVKQKESSYLSYQKVCIFIKCLFLTNIYDYEKLCNIMFAKTFLPQKTFNFFFIFLGSCIWRYCFESDEYGERFAHRHTLPNNTTRGGYRQCQCKKPIRIHLSWNEKIVCFLYSCIISQQQRQRTKCFC